MTKIEQDILAEIRELALNDPKHLIEKYLDIGKFEACVRRKKGQTLQQIAIAMGMPRTTIADKCSVC